MKIKGLRNLRACAIAVFTLLLIGVLPACRNKPFYSTSVLPAGDMLSMGVDTFTVQTGTVLDSPAVSNNLSTYMVGQINNDPLFSTTTAGLYAQFNLPTGNAVLKDDIVAGNNLVDSVVLSLALSGYYGDTLVPQSFEVYEITQATGISETAGTIYHSNVTFPVNATLLGSATNYTAHPGKPVQVFGTTEASEIRIKLPTSFGQNIAWQSNSSNFVSNATFHAFLNGLYVKPVGTTGSAMYYIDVNSAYSCLTLYYHTTITGEDSLRFIMPLSSTSVNTNSHSYGSAPALANLDGSNDDNICFIQGASGLRVKLALPYLSALKNKLINHAQLLVTVIDSSGEALELDPSGGLTLTRYDTDGKEHYVDDLIEATPFHNVSASAYFGGVLGRLNGDRGYTFNLARYLQKRLSGIYALDENIYLSIPNPAGNASRVVIGGGSQNLNRYRAKLVVTFTNTK